MHKTRTSKSADVNHVLSMASVYPEERRAPEESFFQDELKRRPPEKLKLQPLKRKTLSAAWLKPGAYIPLRMTSFFVVMIEGLWSVREAHETNSCWGV
jgi:hypothetical protein